MTIALWVAQVLGALLPCTRALSDAMLRFIGIVEVVGAIAAFVAYGGFFIEPLASR